MEIDLGRDVQSHGGGSRVEVEHVKAHRQKKGAANVAFREFRHRRQ